MDQRRLELQVLMRDHNLTRPQVARLAGVALSTVNAWLAPPWAVRRREIPARAMRLLELELEQGGGLTRP